MVGEPGQDALEGLVVDAAVERLVQPPLWVMAKTPSTLGNSRLQASSRNRSAMYFDVLAEQFTVLMTAT